jgi:rubrerythrin
MDETIEDLFELAITAEKLTQVYYHGLIGNFSPWPEVSDFWKGMVKNEMQHATELTNIRDSLGPSQLRALADPPIHQKAKHVTRFSVKGSLNSIRTLDDAYNISHDIEFSEVNAVFEFLIREYIPSGKLNKFVLSEIENHLAKLMKFNETLGDAEWRKSIVIKSP